MMACSIRERGTVFPAILALALSFVIPGGSGTAEAFDSNFVVSGGCSQRINRVCSEIHIVAGRRFVGSTVVGTDVVVTSTVFTQGVLRQGSMKSQSQGQSLVTPGAGDSTGFERCVWNGIDEDGCTNIQPLFFPCDVPGHNIIFTSEIRASSNLFDEIVLTGHGQQFSAYLNACNGTFNQNRS